MSERMTNILGYLTLFAIMAAIWVMFGEDPTRDQGARGERTFVGLEERINEVATIVLKQDGVSATINRTEGGWVIVDRSGYKADGEKAIAFLRGLALSDRREPKTTNKDRYKRLGLAEKALTIELKDDTGGQLLSFDMGKRTGNASGRSLTYISQERDTRSWLVSGLTEASSDPTWWLDDSLLDIDEKRVSDVKIDGAWLTRKLTETNFTLQGMRDGEEAKAYWQLREPARVITSLTFVDVKQLANPLSDPVTTAVLTTHDGLTVTLMLYKMDDGTWAQLSAVFDAELRGEGAAGVLEAAPVDGAAEGAEIQAEVQGWFFKLGSGDADVLTRQRADFLKEKIE